MNICGKIKAELERHGREISVSIEGNSSVCRAIITPLKYKNKMYLEENITLLGARDTSRSLYIGPAELDFTGDWASVTVGDGRFSYSVARADMIYCDDHPAFVRAVLYDRIFEGE